MYIDDIRNPKGEFDIIVRSSVETIDYMNENVCPSFISFDHDLGGDDTSIVIVHYMIEKDLNSNGKYIPEGFTWNIHSANPVGVLNIDSLLKSYMKYKG